MGQFWHTTVSVALASRRLLKNGFAAHPANNALGSAVRGPGYFAPRSCFGHVLVDSLQAARDNAPPHAPMQEGPVAV